MAAAERFGIPSRFEKSWPTAADRRASTFGAMSIATSPRRILPSDGDRSLMTSRRRPLHLQRNRPHEPGLRRRWRSPASLFDDVVEAVGASLVGELRLSTPPSPRCSERILDLVRDAAAISAGASRSFRRSRSRAARRCVLDEEVAPSGRSSSMCETCSRWRGRSCGAASRRGSAARPSRTPAADARTSGHSCRRSANAGRCRRDRRQAEHPVGDVVHRRDRPSRVMASTPCEVEDQVPEEPVAVQVLGGAFGCRRRAVPPGDAGSTAGGQPTRLTHHAHLNDQAAPAGGFDASRSTEGSCRARRRSGCRQVPSSSWRTSYWRRVTEVCGAADGCGGPLARFGERRSRQVGRPFARFRTDSSGTDLPPSALLGRPRPR